LFKRLPIKKKIKKAVRTRTSLQSQNNKSFRLLKKKKFPKTNRRKNRLQRKIKRRKKLQRKLNQLKSRKLQKRLRLLRNNRLQRNSK
jgi:hypothetical protein